MARAGDAVQLTFDVPGRSATDVGRLVAAEMAGDLEYGVAQGGPESFQLVRTYRPSWALVAGAAGLVVFGLGILFFLVRRTESCLVAVVDGPTGAAVTVAGRLLPGRVDRLRAAAEGELERPASLAEVLPASMVGAGRAPVAVSMQPTRLLTEQDRIAVDLREISTSLPTDETVVVDRTASYLTTPDARHAVRLDDGRTIELDRRVILGRDPSPVSGAGTDDVRLVSVADPGMQVSKTHLAIGVTGDAVWVVDLNSTNGTTVLHPEGTCVSVRPGEQVSVPAGGVVRFGGASAEVVAGA